ncbi:Bug family tripartite tricarboxylate transporter substrate binding protein [Massilia niastensis]|uniref:Bug family tripartite tricarboxylate transporter substrate binding protein n=1 Tax=Massilia niastensis TaxID=544911 RepID=UPI0003A3571D|nr:tripartite tricarboxylate transporter substrate binding protein [Massilia niastensis]
MFRKLACSMLLLTSSAVALAQSLPSRPISLIVPNPPGGVVDTAARVIGQPLGQILKHTVVVDNRPGGSGNIAYQMVARSAPDGATLLVSYSAYHTANPALMTKLPWAPKDFTPVALLVAATNVIAVHPSLPVNNLRELIAYLKKNPGKVSYASQGNGSLSHIGTELFKQQTGTDMLHVPYKGSGQAISDVLSGQVQIFITTPPSVMQHVQSGKLKALAVAGKTHHPMMPTVPTTAEAGLPEFTLEAWVGLFAPAGTPPALVTQLSESVKQALETPEARKQAAAQGVEVRYLNPAALNSLVNTELDYWQNVIKKANIKLD